MVIGEDLGTVPDGFRDRLTKADIPGMRVLWFERKGAEVLPPADYPPLSVACVATHDLPTLAGWWQGADIAERLALGLLTLAEAGDAIAERRDEKRGLVAALWPRPDRLRARRGRAARRCDRRRGPRPGRRRRLGPRQRPVRRSRRRDDGDQSARHRPRAAELAAEVGAERRRGPGGASGAGDSFGAGEGARVEPVALEWRLPRQCFSLLSPANREKRLAPRQWFSHKPIPIKRLSKPSDAEGEERTGRSISLLNPVTVTLRHRRAGGKLAPPKARRPHCPPPSDR